MSEPKTIRCSKCHVEMSIRQFVAHRTSGGAPCTRLPCPACGGPVGDDAVVAHGAAVCSRFCAQKMPRSKNTRESVREVDDQLTALRRAEVLPPVYQRRPRAG